MAQPELARVQPEKRRAGRTQPLPFSYTIEELSRDGKDELIAVERRPFIAFRAFGGWLLGRNDGEFGGELMFQANSGGTTWVLRDENIVDIFRMPFGIVVLAGLDHLGRESGSLFLVSQVTDTQLTAEKLHGLPSAPTWAEHLSSGDLLIQTRRGELLLEADGSLRPIRCVGP